MANIIGPDVSFYQDDPQTPQGIEFSKMRANAGYVIIRAGQNLWADRDFKVNWREAKLAGLPRGSYWFYDSRVDPSRQAELWISLYNGDFGELPLFCDFEDSYGGPFGGWKNWYPFIERIKDLAPEKEISIYTAYYYWLENTVSVGIPASSLEYFKQYPLWIANYGVTKPLVPKPWTDWTFWQFTANGDGSIYGVESKNIDLNYFNGDMDAFHQRFGLSDLPIPESASPDKFFRSLNGWSFSAYLKRVSIPTPEPPPDEENIDWYRVTTSSLKVREEPGLEFAALGLVHFGDFVEKIGITTNGSWLKIRNSDDTLTGWGPSEYFQSANAPAPEEPPTATPVPDHSDKNWYRVNTSALNVRESPTASSKVVATLLKNDIIPALDDRSNPGWVQIQRLDGMTGWCSKTYLAPLGNGLPASIRQSLFPGITYLRKILLSPRQNAIHVMAIDLKTVNLEFLVTPSPNTDNILCARVTSKFLEEFKLHVAINGGYFSYLDATHDPAAYCPNGGDPVRISDYAASRGKIYSPKKTAQPIIYFGPRNQVTVNKEQGNVFNAISGDRIVVDGSLVVKNLAANAPNPRTAIGINKNARWLTLMVVDGRQPGYSEGVTFPELAELLISYGVYTGVNMDGGGSSTMTIQGFDGKARVLNSPIDMNKPGKERAVANHLGLFIKS